MNKDKGQLNEYLVLGLSLNGYTNKHIFYNYLKTVFDYHNVAHLLNIFKMISVCDCVAHTTLLEISC